MSPQQIAELKSAVSGAVAVAGDEVYARASEMFKRTLAPSVVVRPASAEDVAAAIRFAREHRLPIAIKSGGHSNVVHLLEDGMLLIDLSGLALVEVIDADKGLVRVGAGALAGDVADVLDKYGLGIASGDSRVVGIGGLTTGGGMGFLMRKYGPLVDDIVSAEVVIADGSIVNASQESHPDLFWAVRGGGGNFGVVTHFTFQAHPVKGVFDGVVAYPLESAVRVIKGWRDAMRQAPAELTSILKVLPPMGDAGAQILIHSVYDGTDEVAARNAFAPLLALGEPLHREIRAVAYKDALETIGGRALGARSIARNVFIREFTDDAIGAIAKLCADGKPPILQVRHVAGAMSQGPADATAFSHRDSEVLIYHPTSVALDAADEDVERALEDWRVIEPFGTGRYLNMTSEDTQEELAQIFPPATLERLRNVKAQYDPENIFKSHFNIMPASLKAHE